MQYPHLLAIEEIAQAFYANAAYQQVIVKHEVFQPAETVFPIDAHAGSVMGM